MSQSIYYVKLFVCSSHDSSKLTYYLYRSKFVFKIFGFLWNVRVCNLINCECSTEITHCFWIQLKWNVFEEEWIKRLALATLWNVPFHSILSRAAKIFFTVALTSSTPNLFASRSTWQDLRNIFICMHEICELNTITTFRRYIALMKD